MFASIQTVIRIANNFFMGISPSFFDVLGILKAIGSIIGVDIRPNLVDTPFAFYLPSIFSVGLRSGIIIFIYMQFFKGLPKELEEAAAIDGANSLKTFFSPKLFVIFSYRCVETKLF